MGNTCICMPGMFEFFGLTNYLGKPFVPEFFARSRGYRKITLAYNLLRPSNAHATDAMNNLYNAILKYGPLGQVDVIGHSLGSQVIFKLLREKTAALLAAGINPANIRFICLGCPESKFNGACVVDPVGHPGAKYPGPVSDGSGGSGTVGGYGVGYGLPPTVPWNVWVVTRQYDGWGDCNTDLTNAAATANANAGRKLVHVDYTMVTMAEIFSAPSTMKYVDSATPTVTYVWTATTYPLPVLDSTKRNINQTVSEDRDQRPGVESGHTRPGTVMVPAPVYSPAPSWTQFQGP